MATRRFTKKQRQQIARECLRQLWQLFDAGGVSMGRSLEADLLEVAMDLIPLSQDYCKLADSDRNAFLQIARDARHEVSREQIEAQHRKLVEMDSGGYRYKRGDGI